MAENEERHDDEAHPAEEPRPWRPAPRPKRIVICLDGTWNNPAMAKQRDDGDEVFKPTNVLKTSRAIRHLDDTTATLHLATAPTDGETVTIDGKVYRFVDDLGDDDGEDGAVAIGDDAAETIENLHYAIEAKGGRKKRYAPATTRHPTVGARRLPGDRRSLEVFARGAEGDAFAVAAELAHGAWADKAAIAAAYRERGLDPHQGIPQIAYYDLGVGGLREFSGAANRLQRTVDKAVGGATGAGFEGNVEDAYHFLSMNYRPGDEIYLFGFSRGAATARGVSRFVDWMGGILPPHDAYWIPRYFDAFLAGDSFRETRQAIRDERIRRAKKRKLGQEEAEKRADRIVGEVLPARIHFLGVWDTVLALGEKRERPHVGTVPAAAVRHARQAIAVDERRADFQPRIWERTHPESPDQTLEQRWFPGVHTNIGGGYVHDGLANLALHWLLGEARKAGLGLDVSFLRRYAGYPQDRLYDSMKMRWKVIQTITMRRGKGLRDLWVSERAGLTIDPSVFVRLASEKKEGKDKHPRLDKYRPQNLIDFLAELDDVDAFLAGVPGLPEDYELPKDVRKKL